MSEKYFETIRCKDFEVFNLEFHNKRVAKTIGMNLNLQEYIYPNSEKFIRCKLIYSEEGVSEVEYHDYKKRDIKSFKVIFDDKIEYSKKYLDRKNLDELFGRKEKADEIVIIKNGFVTDTSIANIAIFDGRIWQTPKNPLLYGTTRDRLLEERKIFEKDIDFEMLKTAKKIALMNAMIDFEVIEDYSFLA